MRTWKIEGPPEMVDGMVMKVMTSCSLRPASRARNPPMAWMPSCELPAMRITASETFDILGVPSIDDEATLVSLMKVLIQILIAVTVCKVKTPNQRGHRCLETLTLCSCVSNSNRPIQLLDS